VCPAGALRRDEATGYVTFAAENCNNCLACVDACAYGAIRTDPDGQIIKCDLCGGDPECVKVCETRAIRFDLRQSQKLTRARTGVAAHLDDVVVEG
jgi:Fe-S-cluster-containing hydrogenase component 2